MMRSGVATFIGDSRQPDQRQQFGVPSDDKTWLVMPVPEDCTFASMYLGQESVFFLAHYAEEV